jgi:hypothetical protein
MGRLAWFCLFQPLRLIELFFADGRELGGCEFAAEVGGDGVEVEAPEVFVALLAWFRGVVGV